MSLFISFIILSFLVLTGVSSNILPIEYIKEFVPVIPGPMYTDILVLFILPILIYYLLKLIAPAFIKSLYKFNKFTFIFREKPIYCIIEKNADIKVSRMIYRALLVSLFAFSTSSILVQAGLGSFFRGRALEGVLSDLHYAEAVFFGTFLIIGLCLFLFIPTWYLEDIGLVLYRSFHDQRRTPVLEGIQNLYINILLIYTGIATIQGYFILTFRTFAYIINNLPPGDPALLTPIILLFLPFILTGLFAVPQYLYEKHLEKTRNRINDKLIKSGVIKRTTPNIEELRIE